MAPKTDQDNTGKSTGKWNDESHKRLCAGLNEALIAAGSSAAQQQAKILEAMNTGQVSTDEIASHSNPHP